MIERPIKKISTVPFDTAIKWFVFWAIGVRLFTSGLTQVINPAYTSELLTFDANYMFMIQEHGCANIAIGLLGILSLFSKNFREPAAITAGIYMLGAAILHSTRLGTMSGGEFIVLMTDIIIVLIAAVFLLYKYNKNKDTQTRR
ncbi:MAG: hypothetical protein FWF69_01385 [Firmicutes bacterium]|nr:hypothetical protein [Bacillota bacterium]